MTNSTLEISVMILDTNADKLAGIILPFLDRYEPIKGGYRYTIHDDGDHLFIELKDGYQTELYFEDCRECYILHLSSDAEIPVVLKYAIDLVSVFNRFNVIYRLEIAMENEDGSLQEEQYIYSESFPHD